jgi:hypothetical protein
MRREMRGFGLIMAVGLTAVGLFLRWRGHAPQAWPYILAAAGVFLALALAFPPALRIAHKPWMLLGAALAWINTRIILCAVFVVLFTPIGLFMRLFRIDLLNADWRRRADSYWTPPRNTESKKQRYERMS